MDASKLSHKEGKDVYRFSIPNVYEVAVASAKEAKRINQRLFTAKKMPPENVTIKAIKDVIGGGVTYTLDGGASNGGGEEREEVNGHS